MTSVSAAFSLFPYVGQRLWKEQVPSPSLLCLEPGWAGVTHSLVSSWLRTTAPNLQASSKTKISVKNQTDAKQKAGEVPVEAHCPRAPSFHCRRSRACMEGHSPGGESSSRPLCDPHPEGGNAESSRHPLSAYVSSLKNLCPAESEPTELSQPSLARR